MKFFRLFIPVAAMTVLILDPKTALSGAQAGMELCIRSVIVSLFPFLFLSTMITGAGADLPLNFLRPLARLCRIPNGTESILALGLIGGYPVGAQSIGQAYRENRLDRNTARRLLGFCSNGGPSFIFGFLGTCFAVHELWALWGIHILSALMTGILLPGGNSEHIRVSSSGTTSPTNALERSTKTMALICGWVVLFRVLLAFFRRWFLWMLPAWADVFVSGLMELTNGCSQLSAVESESFRFVLASGMLAFGGVCVGLQTASVTHELGIGSYLTGKAIQTVISILLAVCARDWLFPGERFPFPVLPLSVMLAFIAVFISYHIFKKHSSNLARQGV